MIDSYLVLGASSGVGKELFLKLLSEGKNVVGVSRSIEQTLNDIPSKYSESSLLINYEFKELDDSVKFLSNLSKAHGAFRGIFISVGVESIKTSKLLSDKDLNLVFLPPLIATLSVIKNSFKDKFLSKESSVVVMSSVSAVKSTPGLLLYGSSRAAIESVVKTASLELATKSKNINCIRAGAFKSEMHERVTSSFSSEQLKDYESDFPLGFGEVKDLLGIIDLLMDYKRSRWISGTAINVDGGYLS